VSHTNTGSNKEKKKPEENSSQDNDGEGTVENDKDGGIELIPNTFIIAEEHFQKVIEGMEDCIC
jgi:hypothetical protein